MTTSTTKSSDTNKQTSSGPSPATAPVVGPKVAGSNVTSSTLPTIKTAGTYFNPSMGEKPPETSKPSSPARPPVSQSKIDAIKDIAKKQENTKDTTTTPSAPKTPTLKPTSKPPSKAYQKQQDDDAKMPTAI